MDELVGKDRSPAFQVCGLTVGFVPRRYWGERGFAYRDVLCINRGGISLLRLCGQGSILPQLLPRQVEDGAFVVRGAYPVEVNQGDSGRTEDAFFREPVCEGIGEPLQECGVLHAVLVHVPSLL